jgi:hypothetical protein
MIYKLEIVTQYQKPANLNDPLNFLNYLMVKNSELIYH